MLRRRFLPRRRGAASRADATGDDVGVEGGGDRSSGWLFQSTSPQERLPLCSWTLFITWSRGVIHPDPSERRKMNVRRVSGGFGESYWTDSQETQWKDETLTCCSVQQSISQWRVTSVRSQRGSASGPQRVF